MIHSKSICHSLNGWTCAHSGHAANVGKKCVTIAPTSGKQGILAHFHPFRTPLAYPAPIIGDVTTPMSYSRVHTLYLHLLAALVWLADLSCRRAS